MDATNLFIILNFMKLFQKNKKKASGKKIISRTVFVSAATFGILPFLFIVYLLLVPLVRAIKKDFAAETMMIVSESLNIRSDKDKDAYVIGKYLFGTEVEVFEVFDNNWAEVAVGSKKGYMSFEYLVFPETFHIIKGMFGNEDAQKLIASTQYRKAISNYLKSNNYTSKIPKSEREKLYGKDDEKEAWQIFAEPAKSKYNSFCYGDYNGDGERDAAFILTNIKTGKRKLIVLELNDYIPGRSGNLLGSLDLKEDYLFLRSVYKGRKMIIDGGFKRIDADAIIIGSNRPKSFEDTDVLMLYNGLDFDTFIQKKPEN